MAKGLTSGYVPLGATSSPKRSANYFETHPLTDRRDVQSAYVGVCCGVGLYRSV